MSVGGNQGGIELALETPNCTTREIEFEVPDLRDIDTRCTDENYLIWSIGEESGLYGHKWIRAGMVIQMPSGTSRHQPTSDTGRAKTALVRHVRSGHTVHISDLGRQLHIAEAINQRDRDTYCNGRCNWQTRPETFPNGRL